MPPHKAEPIVVRRRNRGEPKPGSESARVKFLDERFERDKEGARDGRGSRGATGATRGRGRNTIHGSLARGTRRLSSPPLPSSLASRRPPFSSRFPTVARTHPLPR